MQKVTTEEFRAGITPEFRDLALTVLTEDKDLPERAKTLPKMVELWVASSWLGARLEEAGCPAQMRKDILFALGQRSFFCDPYEVAAFEWNNFVGGTPDTPSASVIPRP
jgi:hypothetical protein